VCVQGALVGAAAAVACIAPIVIGSQYSISKGLLYFPSKPLTTEGCTEMFNESYVTLKNVTPVSYNPVPYGPTR